MKKMINGFIWFLSILIGIAIFIGCFSYYFYNQGYRSVSFSEKQYLFSGITPTNIILTDSGSSRRTGNTLMSIPEWYIVTLSDDYTHWLEAGNNPSDFPYFYYLRDYWIAYGRITGLMDGLIDRDAEYHTMIRVIGLSTTLEFGLKAFYEKSLGRLTSFFSYDTGIDRYYAQSSRRYVDFILLKPWYLFDYVSERRNMGFSDFSLRSIERYIVYATEFFLKEQYANVIERATRATFSVPDIWTTVMGDVSLSGSYDSDFVRVLSGGITIQRYYPFTEIYPKILPDSSVLSIAGNRNIVIEGVFERNSIPDTLSSFRFLILPSYIGNGEERVFLYVPVSELHSIISVPGFRLLHIYDF